jgi:hypothetical protein
VSNRNSSSSGCLFLVVIFLLMGYCSLSDEAKRYRVDQERLQQKLEQLEQQRDGKK